MKLQSRLASTGVWIASILLVLGVAAVPKADAQAVSITPATTALGIVAIGETSAAKTIASTGQLSSLISDVYDLTFTRYLSLFKLPVLSLPLDQIGQRMQGRNNYNLSLATATYTGGANPSITITIPDTATVTSATIPVTGLNSATVEVYGGQNISHVPVTQGTSVTLPAQ